jgi:hypothetical protein
MALPPPGYMPVRVGFVILPPTSAPVVTVPSRWTYIPVTDNAGHVMTDERGNVLYEQGRLAVQVGFTTTQ